MSLRFRACCESRYDWSGAGVPEALTAEAEAAQREREKEKKRRAKQRKAEAHAQQPAPAPSAAASTLASGEGKPPSEAATDLHANSKKANGQSSSVPSAVPKGKKEEPKCASCGQVLNKRTSVDVFDKKACGPDCAVKLRRRIQAEAAEARLKGGSGST
jgi:hypothetical protein